MCCGIGCLLLILPLAWCVIVSVISGVYWGGKRIGGVFAAEGEEVVYLREWEEHCPRVECEHCLRLELMKERLLCIREGAGTSLLYIRTAQWMSLSVTRIPLHPTPHASPHSLNQFLSLAPFQSPLQRILIHPNRHASTTLNT